MARLDRTGRRSLWQVAQSVERSYSGKLVKVAKQIGDIVLGLAPEGEVSAAQEREIRYAMDRYAALLKPWATSVANYMLADVNRRNERTWRSVGKEMSAGLRAELLTAPTGMVYSALMDEQVALIQSMPLRAAQRVHDLVQQGMVDSTRAEDIAKAVQRTGHVTASRARLIARTEVARAAASLTQARAMYAGSEGYIWRTSRDADVRPEHKKMDGKYVRWDKPPQTDPGLEPYHAGCGPNCRCYPEPIFPAFE